MLLEQGVTTGAAESLRRALAVFDTLLTTEPSNEKYRAAVPFVYQKSSEVMLWQGDAVGALATSRKALALDTKLSTAYPMNTHYRQEVGVDYEKVGNTLENLGDIKGALESYREELRIFAEQSVADPANAQFRSDLSSAYLKVGSMLARVGKPADALLNQNKALAIREEAATADPLDSWKRWDLIESYAKTSNALAKAGNAVAALDACRKTQALLADTIDDPTNVNLRSYRAYASADVGDDRRVGSARASRFASLGIGAGAGAVSPDVFAAWQAYLMTRYGGPIGGAGLSVPLVNLVQELRGAFRGYAPTAVWDLAHVLLILAASGTAMWSLRRRVTVINAAACALTLGVLVPTLGDVWSDARLSAPLFTLLLVDGLHQRNRYAVGIGTIAAAMTILIPFAIPGAF